MPTPKRKLSRARRDKRSANKGIKPKAVASCQTCQAPMAAHQVCSGCGYYKGVKVLRTKTERKFVRAKSREEVRSKVSARHAAQESQNQESETSSAS